MNWDGLILSYKKKHGLFLLVVSSPISSSDPEVAVAAARQYRGDADECSDEEIIIRSTDWPGRSDLCIKLPRIDVRSVGKIEDQINPRVFNQLGVVGNLDERILYELRVNLSRSIHVKGAVKEHLKVWVG